MMDFLILLFIRKFLVSLILILTLTFPVKISILSVSWLLVLVSVGEHAQRKIISVIDVLHRPSHLH